MYNYDRAVVALQAKCMFWLLTAHIKDDLFLERIRHSIRSHMANIWERSAHTISLIPPSKSSSSLNTSNRDPTSFILMSAKLSRRVGWNETVRACRDPFDNNSTRKFWLNGFRPPFLTGAHTEIREQYRCPYKVSTVWSMSWSSSTKWYLDSVLE